MVILVGRLPRTPIVPKKAKGMTAGTTPLSGTCTAPVASLTAPLADTVYVASLGRFHDGRHAVKCGLHGLWNLARRHWSPAQLQAPVEVSNLLVSSSFKLRKTGRGENYLVFSLSYGLNLHSVLSYPWLGHLVRICEARREQALGAAA